MSFFISDAQTGALSLSDPGLVDFAKRNLGQDYLQFRDQQYLNSIKDPETFIKNKNAFRDKIYQEAAESYKNTFKKLYNELSLPLEAAQNQALMLSQRELQGKLGLVEEAFPSNIGKIAGSSLFDNSVINDPGRYTASVISKVESEMPVRKPRKRAAGKRKTTKRKK